jgi:hypothetical protein
VTPSLFPGIARQVFHQKRTRPYETHFTAQHIEQFWKFVKTTASKESSKWRQTHGVWKKLPLCIPHLCHGPKLEQHEGLSMKTRSLLPEQHRPTELPAHYEGQKAQERQPQPQRSYYQNQIKRSFHVIPGVRRSTYRQLTGYSKYLPRWQERNHANIGQSTLNIQRAHVTSIGDF